MFLYQKLIDRSTLRQGFQIPVEHHPLLELMPGGMPAHGETRAIKIFLEGAEYDAELKNQAFDQSKYPDHADVLQIRYGENSAFAQRLRQIFFATWSYVEAEKALPQNQNRKVTIRIPEGQEEYLALSATTQPNVFIAECLTVQNHIDTEVAIGKMDELDFETSFEPKEDDTAGIKESIGIRRVRHLDRTIGDSLKQLYDYRCQMTEERVGDSYGALVVEAHHIIPFTESLNNDTSNIIILSPSYHRIVHRAKPIWDPQEKAFRYTNGLVERVKINKHL